MLRFRDLSLAKRIFTTNFLMVFIPALLLFVAGAALLGAAVLTASDTVARVAFAPVELPVGILMAALGAPFFLFLLRREL